MAAVIEARGGFVPQVALSFAEADGAATTVGRTNPLPVAVGAGAVTYTDRSGAIAAPGSAQPLAAANAGRRGFFIQNLSTGDLWLSSVGVATASGPSVKIAPGQLYESPAHGVPAGAISILGAAAGQAFAAREW